MEVKRLFPPTCDGPWYDNLIDFIKLQSLIMKYKSTLKTITTQQWVEEDEVIKKRGN